MATDPVNDPGSIVITPEELEQLGLYFDASERQVMLRAGEPLPGMRTPKTRAREAAAADQPPARPVLRDERGRLLPGTANISQPRRSEVERRILSRLTRAIIAPDVLDRMAENVARRFADGDLDYLRFVFNYLIGSPVARVDVGLGQGEQALRAWLNDLRLNDDSASEDDATAT